MKRTALVLMFVAWFIAANALWRFRFFKKKAAQWNIATTAIHLIQTGAQTQ